MKKWLSLLIILIIAGTDSSFSAGANRPFPDEARIYFKNWFYLRRAGPSEAAVRQNPDIFIRITGAGEINRLKNLLTTNLIQFDGNVRSVNMVIDFLSNGQIVETYILNKFAFQRVGSDTIYQTPEILLQRYTLIDLFDNRTRQF